MFENLILILIGAFIGWNFPQPQIAKNFQDKFLAPAVAWIKSKIPFLP